MAEQTDPQKLLDEADSYLSLWLHRYPPKDEDLKREVDQLVTKIRCRTR